MRDTKMKLPIRIEFFKDFKEDDLLKTFFEIGTDPLLFEGLKIADETGICERYMGKYPVVSISLKDVDGMDFQTAYDRLEIEVSREERRFKFHAV